MHKFYVLEQKQTRSGYKEEITIYIANNKEELVRDLEHDSSHSPMPFKWCILSEETKEKVVSYL